jgi:enediyne biosynthesis thioesterase
MMPVDSYRFRYEVGFEDTNLSGNVYFANHVRWQGRCRERFLAEHAPSVLADLESGLVLLTLSVTCTYLAELRAFDVLEIRMAPGTLVANRLELLFDYWRVSGGNDELVARGTQWIASMRRSDARLLATPLPLDLVRAIEPYLQGGGPIPCQPRWSPQPAPASSIS